MKRLFALLLIFSLLCLPYVSHSAPAKKASSQEVEIEGKDGFGLVGMLYSASVPKRPLVIMLHSFGMRSNDWGNLPKDIQGLGYNVLALDARGHGKSVYDSNFKFKSYKYFKAEDWKNMPFDVLKAIDFIKQDYPAINYNRIIFIGADLGANTAILTGIKLKNKPEKLVLISPLIDFKGMYTPVILSNYTSTPAMFMASEEDKSIKAQTTMLWGCIQSPVTKKIYPHGGTGMLLIKRNQGAEKDILNFLGAPSQ